MSDSPLPEGTVNLKLWVPVVVGAIAILGVAVAVGKREAALDNHERRLEKIEEKQNSDGTRIGVAEARQDAQAVQVGGLEKKLEKMDAKLDVLLLEKKE